MSAGNKGDGLFVRHAEARDLTAIQTLFRAGHEYNGRTYSDHPALAKLEAQYVESRLCAKGDLHDIQASFVNVPGKMFFVCVDSASDEVVGCVGLDHKPEKPKQGELTCMSVSENHRRRGIGGKLCEALEAHCRTLGYTEVMLGTMNLFKPARGLYERQGFVLQKEYVPDDPDWKPLFEAFGGSVVEYTKAL
eukprot:GFYU01003109.1.p1 GENE.GFYU01003109.1~~GFYU01003109.1.p1  ORF type:complete len:223 (-),score=43.55 GFYU01003109.1:113-688(-)